MIVNENDSLIFYDAMKDVKRLHQKKRVVEKKKNRTTFCISDKNSPKNLLEETLLDNYFVDVANLPEYMEGYIDDISPITIEKLRNGEFSIQRTLDLHGYSSDNARRVFEGFLKEAVMAGLQCVQIIHGRGLKSKYKPVLKENLKMWIVKAMHRKWVTAFSSCTMCNGGPGATCILLRKRPEKKKIRIMG